MVVVDSGVWIDLLSGHPSAASDQLSALLTEAKTPLLAPDLVVFEVLRGIRHERQLKAAKRVFEHILVPSVVGAHGAERAAQRYRKLRALGITIRSAVDVLVASHCIDEDLLLLQRDRDFLPFAQHFGLRLLQPLH